MAADWIKMRVNLLNDPRVEWLAETLGCNAVSVTGALYVLWSRADQHSTDGLLRPYTTANLDTLVGISGFAAALASDEVQWLEVGRNFLKVLEFEKHNGQSAKERAQTQKRVSKHRKERNADTVTEPLPEKRREDKNTSLSTEKKNAASAAVSSPITFETWKEHLPATLHTEPMRAALKRWTRHRSEIRSPLKPTMIESQAEKMAAWGEARAIEVINHTVTMGWKGLREPETPRASGPSSRTGAQQRRDEFDAAIDGLNLTGAKP